jgi:hypothetical protein
MTHNDKGNGATTLFAALNLLSGNHPNAATPDSHPDCRRLPIQIAALH